MQFNNRVAVITGGASGIGAACARAFAAKGARIVCLDINGDGAADVAAKFGGTGFGCDVSDNQDVNEAVARIRKDIGEIDLRHGEPPVPVAVMPAYALHHEPSANSRSGHRWHTKNPAFLCGLAWRMPASGPASKIPQRGS